VEPSTVFFDHGSDRGDPVARRLICHAAIWPAPSMALRSLR
jgi:hypothetical protein